MDNNENKQNFNSGNEDTEQNLSMGNINIEQKIDMGNIDNDMNQNFGDGGDIGKSFADLPIGQLICEPIVAVAKGQSELCRVYLDNLFRLAFVDGDPEKGTNVVKFNLNRQILNTDGTIGVQGVTVEAPILALVPVPAFAMDRTEVDFLMEVKDTQVNKETSDKSIEANTKFSIWKFSGEIKGKVSSTRENQRTTDHSAKYHINATASQMAPAEGMAKLTSIFAATMEPVEAKKA